MPSHADQVRLLHRTTIALSQLYRLLQQATDILSNLHRFYRPYTTGRPSFSPTFSDSLTSSHHSRPHSLPHLFVRLGACCSHQTCTTGTSSFPSNPRLLLHHHYSHNPSANVSLHHPSTKMRIGMLGTLMQISALSSSKLILVSARTGTTLPVE